MHNIDEAKSLETNASTRAEAEYQKEKANMKEYLQSSLKDINDTIETARKEEQRKISDLKKKSAEAEAALKKKLNEHEKKIASWEKEAADAFAKAEQAKIALAAIKKSLGGE